MSELKEIIEPGRRVGNTTRLIDYYVQELFNNFEQEIEIRDHFPHRRADEFLIERLVKRIRSEHPSFEYEINRNKRTIKLINKK